MFTLQESHEQTLTIDGEHRTTPFVEHWILDSSPTITAQRIRVPDNKDAPPVLLVHGFAQNRYTWHTSRRSMAAYLADEGFDVWNLELRGHGRSGEAQRVSVEHFEDYVTDVVRAIEALPDVPFVMGHSLGGAAAYAAATRCPVRGVIGVGAIYHFATDNWAIQALTRVTHRLSLAHGLGGIRMKTQLVGRLMARAYGLSDMLGYGLPISGWWPGSVEPEILDERLRHGFDWTSAKVWLEMARWGVSREFDEDAAWRQLDVPLFVVLGDKDQLVAPVDGLPAFEHSGSSDKTLLLLNDFEHEVHWGHLDLILGRHAPVHVWPAIRDWMHIRI